jgi:hypothetical protein
MRLQLTETAAKAASRGVPPRFLGHGRLGQTPRPSLGRCGGAPRSAAFGAVSAVVLAIVVAGTAHADDSFVAKTQVYTDSDHTTVVSPLVALSRDAWSGGTLNAGYVADVVSSASIDVVTNATKKMTDFRSEISAGLTQKLRATTLSGSYIYSVENDYESHNVELGLSQDLFEKNTTLGLGYTLAFNSVGRSGDQLFHRHLDVNGLSASWTQVLGRSTIGQLSYSFSYNDGFQSSPYRFVPVARLEGGIAYKVPETDPTIRMRHAAVIGLNQHLFTDSAIQADYRFYIDSWGVAAHTIQLRYFVTWKDVTLRIRERFYYQGSADFFRPHYDTVQQFMTTDRELSTFLSNILGFKISWRLPWVHHALAVELKTDVFYFKYLNFALLSDRVGGNVEAGLSVVY